MSRLESKTAVTPTSDVLPAVLPPEDPGTSVRLVRGKPLRSYLTVFGLSSALTVSVWGLINGILLPNQVQLIEQRSFFTGGDAGVDLQKLTNLKAAVAAGTQTATADQSRLLGILSQYEIARASNLALVATVALIIGMVAGPLLGTLSDRTRSRLGRRAPYILFGGLIGAFGLAVMQFAPTIAAMVVIWSIGSIAVSTAQSAQNATVADRVVHEKRGLASSIGGLGSFVGGILGTVLGAIAFGAFGLAGYYVPAALVAIGCVLFVLVARDRSSRDLHPTARGFGEVIRGFLVPLKARDFRWVWVARIILTFGYGVSTAFGLFMLQSYVHPALSQAQATATAPIIVLVGLPGTVIALMVAGRWSDKSGRRKPFVIWSSALMAVSFIVPLFWPTVPGLILQAALAGIAYGAYLAVDQALFIDVLPSMKDAGRDLGIANLGSNIGNALAPIIAAQIFALTGNYLWIWLVALVLVVAAAFAIVPVRSVK